MPGLIHNKNYQKKGVAQFRSAQDTLTGTSGQITNFFDTELYNDSSSIIKVANTQVHLKAGKKYKITLIARVRDFGGTTGYYHFKLYDVTNSQYIGQRTSTVNMEMSRLSGTNTNANYSIISLTEDTLIEVRVIEGNGTGTLMGGEHSNIFIEEVEAYLNESWNQVQTNKIVLGKYDITYNQDTEDLDFIFRG